MAVKKQDPIFYCDCCKKSVISAMHLARIKVPCRVWNDKGEEFIRQLTELSLCDSCTNKFWEACDQNFAIVECSNVVPDVVVTAHFDIDKIKYRDLTWPEASDKAADESEVVKL